MTSGTYDLRNLLVGYNGNGILSSLSSGSNDHNAFFSNAGVDYQGPTQGTNDLFAMDPRDGFLHGLLERFLRPVPDPNFRPWWVPALVPVPRALVHGHGMP